MYSRILSVFFVIGLAAILGSAYVLFVAPGENINTPPSVGSTPLPHIQDEVDTEPTHDNEVEPDSVNDNDNDAENGLQDAEEEEIVEDTSSPEPVQDTSITLEEAADPVHIEIPVHNISAEIDLTGLSYNSERFNPTPGRVDFWLDRETVKPCEAGPSYILGHVMIGGNPGVFFNLVDDPEIADDTGVPIGSEVIITLEDSTQCIFEVVDFTLPVGEPVPETPAHRVNKDDWAEELWQETIDLVQQDPVLFLLTSGGTEFEGGHRVYADVLMAELVRVEN